MPRAVLITSHFWNSKRKAGFHNIADSLLKKGYEVLFLTGNASIIHHLKGDYRAALINSSSLNKLISEKNNLKQFIRFTFLHPVNFGNPLLNKAALPAIKKYSESLKDFDDVNNFINGSDLFIFESFPGILWFDHFKKLNPSAKFVYRMSDDMTQLKKHPYVIGYEKIILTGFDLVSVPSEYIFNRFKGNRNVKLHHHGIRKDLFDREKNDPYQNSKEFNMVFTGSAYFDYDFLKNALTSNEKSRYHIIGRFKKKISDERVVFYGELNFEDTIPYVKFADAGLHTLRYTKGAEGFSDSLKVIQYTYCKLPVIAPEFIKSSRKNFIYYKPGDMGSISDAVRKAKEFDRNIIDISGIGSWDEVTSRLIAE